MKKTRENRKPARRSPRPRRLDDADLGAASGGGTSKPARSKAETPTESVSFSFGSVETTYTPMK